MVIKWEFVAEIFLLKLCLQHSLESVALRLIMPLICSYSTGRNLNYTALAQTATNPLKALACREMIYLLKVLKFC